MTLLLHYANYVELPGRVITEGCSVTSVISPLKSPKELALICCFDLNIAGEWTWTLTHTLLPVRSPLKKLCFPSRGSCLQDCALRADDSHRDRHPHYDLHCYWEIPGHCFPTENEATVLFQKSIQGSRYAVLKHACFWYWNTTQKLKCLVKSSKHTFWSKKCEEGNE